MIEMSNIDILSMTKTAQQPYPLGATHTYVAHKRETPSDIKTERHTS